MKDWVTLCNGVVQVNRHGQVKRLKGSVWEVAPHIYSMQGGKKGNVKSRIGVTVITYRDTDNKFKRKSVKSLVAEAFLENYVRGKNINHIDKDYKNCELENLKIISDKEVASKSAKTKRSKKIKCDVCGKYNRNSVGVCATCRKKQADSESRRKIKILKIEERYKNVDMNSLSPIKRKILEDRLKGETLSVIGDKYGLSKQSINMKLKRIEETFKLIK